MSSPAPRRSQRNSQSATPRRSVRGSQPIPSSPLAAPNGLFSDDAQYMPAQGSQQEVPNGVNAQRESQPDPGLSSPMFFNSSSVANSDGDRTPRASAVNGNAPGGENRTQPMLILLLIGAKSPRPSATFPALVQHARRIDKPLVTLEAPAAVFSFDHHDPVPPTFRLVIEGVKFRRTYSPTATDDLSSFWMAMADRLTVNRARPLAHFPISIRIPLKQMHWAAPRNASYGARR